MIETFFLAFFDVLPALVVGGLLGAWVTHLYGEYRELRESIEARRARADIEAREFHEANEARKAYKARNASK